MRLPDPALALLASQHGVIGRHQLRSWLPESTIDTLVQRRRLRRLERGIYRVEGGVVTPQGRAMAAVLRAVPARGSPGRSCWVCSTWTASASRTRLRC